MGLCSSTPLALTWGPIGKALGAQLCRLPCLPHGVVIVRVLEIPPFCPNCPDPHCCQSLSLYCRRRPSGSFCMIWMQMTWRMTFLAERTKQRARCAPGAAQGLAPAAANWPGQGVPCRIRGGDDDRRTCNLGPWLRKSQRGSLL